MRAQTKAIEAQLRAQGEPSDRCSLNATIYEGLVVARAASDSPLKLGDRLVLLNGEGVTGMTPDEAIGRLRAIRPDATVSATVDREGDLTDLQIPCVNARDTYEPMLQALEFASRGKFDDCVRTISTIRVVDTRADAIKVQCASVSRNPEQHNVPEMMAGTLAMAVEDARYARKLRVDVINQLRGSEAMISSRLGAARFQALVDATRSWPGGETLFDSMAPDWLQFRRNAESAVRSRLIDPDSAKISWPYGFRLGSWKSFLQKPIEGYWTCGLVNARNRMGGYAGTTAFVVVLDQSGAVKFSEVGQSGDYDFLSASCKGSAKLLPAPPPALMDPFPPRGG